MKQKQGNIMSFLPILFSLAAVAILSLMYVSYLKDVDVKDQVDLIAREYILKMETTGYLASVDENALIGDLNRIGVHDVNLGGTTRAEVGYGSPVTLSVAGYVESEQTGLQSLFDISRSKKRIGVKVVKTSTAKH